MGKKTYNTTLDADMLKKLKILAAETGKRQNELIEEAIGDLLLKYEKQGEEVPRAQEA
ncbi:MAG: ribbon-helix-helix domain-containing protein [Desulfobaccales bacterium]